MHLLILPKSFNRFEDRNKEYELILTCSHTASDRIPFQLHIPSALRSSVACNHCRHMCFDHMPEHCSRTDRRPTNPDSGTLNANVNANAVVAHNQFVPVAADPDSLDFGCRALVGVRVMVFPNRSVLAWDLLTAHQYLVRV